MNTLLLSDLVMVSRELGRQAEAKLNHIVMGHDHVAFSFHIFPPAKP